MNKELAELVKKWNKQADKFEESNKRYNEKEMYELAENLGASAESYRQCAYELNRFLELNNE